MATDNECMQSFFGKAKNILLGKKIDKSIPKTIKCKIVKTIDIDHNDHTRLSLDDSRILIVDNCDTIEHLLQVMREEKMKTYLEKSSHCFVVVANIKKLGSFDLDDFATIFDCASLAKSVLIIELFVESVRKSNYYFKNHLERKLRTCDIEMEEISEETFEHRMMNFDFNFLLKTLYWKRFGSFAGKILKWKIDVDIKFKGKSLLEWAVESNNTLVVRFLKLFIDKAPDLKLLEAALKLPTSNMMSALLDLDIVDDGKEIFLDRSLSTSLTSKLNGFENLLCGAVKLGSAESVRFVLRMDLWNQNFNEALAASNSALMGRKFENLLILLSNDFPFPDDFERIVMLSEEKEADELKAFFTRRQELHAAIQTNEIGNVKTFIDENPDARFAFSPSNTPALRAAFDQALILKDYKIYALLMYHRFTAHGDSEYHKDQVKLVKQEITKAREFCYGKPVDSHIFFIYSKTRLGFGYDKQMQRQHFERIKSFLDELNNIEDIVPVLKVIEHSYSLLIVFDFDSSNVSKIDLRSSESTMGICNLTSGRIFIGAKTSKSEVLGTLIHELTHYAMQILFNNRGNPFYASDTGNQKSFIEIVDEVKTFGTSNVPIVRKVFSGGYTNEKHCAELIVRIPEMMAFYRNETDLLEKFFDQKYKNLARFFLTQIKTKLEDFYYDPGKFQSSRDVQQLNDRLGNIRELSDIKIHEIDFKPLENKVSTLKTAQIIVSNIPHFTIAS